MRKMKRKTKKRIGNIISAILFLLAICFAIYTVAPIVQFYLGNQESAQEWEEIKDLSLEELMKSENVILAPTIDLTQEEKEDKFGALVGTLYLEHDPNKIIPIRYGTDEETLKKGAGVDYMTCISNEANNSVIYGHREQYFWELQNVKIGEKIFVETPLGTYIYEVYEAQERSPYDSEITRTTDESEITLVTCYPFVYMAPVTNRYVVKAKLVEEVNIDEQIH